MGKDFIEILTKKQHRLLEEERPMEEKRGPQAGSETYCPTCE